MLFETESVKVWVVLAGPGAGWPDGSMGWNEAALYQLAAFYLRDLKCFYYNVTCISTNRNLDIQRFQLIILIQ